MRNTVKNYSLKRVKITAILFVFIIMILGFYFVTLNSFSKSSESKKMESLYEYDLDDISKIKINTEKLCINVVSTEDVENKKTLKIIYDKNYNEQCDISKNLGLIEIKSKNYKKENWFQRFIFNIWNLTFLKWQNSDKFRINNLLIKIPKSYDGDISIISKKANNASLFINDVKNITNLYIDTDNPVNIENITCSGFCDLKAEKNCSLTDVISHNSIKIKTIVGEVNLKNVSSRRSLNVSSIEAPIRINEVCSGVLSFASPLGVAGNIKGNKNDYIIKNIKDFNKKEEQSIVNPKKKFLFIDDYSNIKFNI